MSSASVISQLSGSSDRSGKVKTQLPKGKRNGGKTKLKEIKSRLVISSDSEEDEDGAKGDEVETIHYKDRHQRPASKRYSNGKHRFPSKQDFTPLPCNKTQACQHEN